MSKVKISLIVFVFLAAIAGIWTAIHSYQKKAVQPVATNQPQKAEAPKEAINPTNETVKQTDTIDLKISSFQKNPTLATLSEVENLIRKQLPVLSLEQRYKLLDQWEKVLTPLISRLDPGQGKLISTYGTIENTYVEGESANERVKRFERDFAAALDPKQKSLFQQLAVHQIEITEAEEVGPVFKLKPAYWKGLFASSLVESDQKFWDQKAIENDPVIDFDAGLAVDRVTLGDWAFSWEQYIKKYPKSHYQKQAEENYRSYMGYILMGLENTATLDSETNKIAPDVDADFDTIIKHHPHSAVANSIAVFRKKINEADSKSNIQTNLYTIANSIIKNTK